jgi:hypothetical protein
VSALPRRRAHPTALDHLIERLRADLGAAAFAALVMSGCLVLTVDSTVRSNLDGGWDSILFTACDLIFVYALTRCVKAALRRNTLLRSAVRRRTARDLACDETAATYGSHAQPLAIEPARIGQGDAHA